MEAVVCNESPKFGHLGGVRRDDTSDRLYRLVLEDANGREYLGGLVNFREWSRAIRWLKYEGTGVDRLVCYTFYIVSSVSGGVSGARAGAAVGARVPLVGPAVGAKVGGVVGCTGGAITGLNLTAKYVKNKEGYAVRQLRRQANAVQRAFSFFLEHVDVELSDATFRCAISDRIMCEVWRAPSSNGQPSRLVDVCQIGGLENCRPEPLLSAQLYERLRELLHRELERDLSADVKRALAQVSFEWRCRVEHYRELAIRESEDLYCLRPQSSTTSLFLAADDVAIRLLTNGYPRKDAEKRHVQDMAKLSWYARGRKATGK